MKTFDWANLLRHHPIFATLRDDKRVQWLLDDEVSTERTYAPEAVILREGEVGDSIFLIGSGSVEVSLSGEGGQKVSVATLRPGEIFGEMAFFERRARSATVTAREAATILEVRGPEFGKLIDEYPDIEFKVLLKMSERLRNTDAQVLAAQFRNVDDKLKRFDERLDVQQRMVDTSLKSAVAVFDQTKLRADEVINSADRSRTRVTATTAAILGVLTLVGSALGGLGFWQFLKVQDQTTKIEQMKAKAEEAGTKANAAAAGAEKSAQSIVLAHQQVAQMVEGLAKTRQTIERTMELAMRDLRIRFERELQGAKQWEAFNIYRLVREVDPDNQEVADRLLDSIEGYILNPPEKRSNFDELLKQVLKHEMLTARPGEASQAAQAARAAMGRREVVSCHLLLANAILSAPPERFDEILSECRDVVMRNKTIAIELAGPDGTWARLREYVGKQRDRMWQDRFQRADRVVLAR